MSDWLADDMIVYHPVRRPGAVRATLAALAEMTEEWSRRVRSRNELAAMSGRELRDIGVTGAERAYELSKPFWRA